MTNITRSTRGVTLLAGTCALMLLSGCKVNDVLNPSVIDATAFNPTSDGPTISLSAQTAFWAAFQNLVTYGGYFAEEHINGAARTEPTDIGRRSLTPANQDIDRNMWTPLSRAISANENVTTALGSGSGAASDINLARAQMNLGLSLALMGETFCNGAIQSGPSLTPVQLLDSAIVLFNKAITVASAAGGTEGPSIVNVSKIGIARAQLQKGDYSNAYTSATTYLGQVPAGFTYNLITVNDGAFSPTDASNIRVNEMYSWTYQSKLSSVPNSYRALNPTGSPSGPGDTRITWVDGGAAQDGGPANGGIEAYQQLKYSSAVIPIRISSYLELQYIQAEAALQKSPSDPTVATALIATRTAAGGASAPAPTEPSTLGKLLDLAARDFWLEAKKAGDYRRNPTVEPFISPAGAAYKGAFVYGSDKCIPIPQSEINANTNLH